MKANIKLSPWIPLLFIVIVAIFLIQGFSALDVVMILGAVFVVGYFGLGYIKRKDALIITENTMIVTTPFKRREYVINEITELSIKDSDEGTLKAVYQGEPITLCTDIYDVSIAEIKVYLGTHYQFIVEKSSEIEKK